jgi:hypothetical protein
MAWQQDDFWETVVYIVLGAAAAAGVSLSVSVL